MEFIFMYSMRDRRWQRDIVMGASFIYLPWYQIASADNGTAIFILTGVERTLEVAAEVAKKKRVTAYTP